jgi:bacterioferritin-associated ferredoxin
VIVCHCKAVNEHRIRDAVRSGARSCRQVTRACDAGGHCGGCRPVIREIIAREGNDTRLLTRIQAVTGTS